jgi:hypothetical protein
MSDPLFVFFGAESEYVLNPLFDEMKNRGHDCIELHATPTQNISGALEQVLRSEKPKVLVTSAHFGWDEHYMMSAMEVPDCPALVDLIPQMKPIFTVYYPHDLSQPLLTPEVACIPFIDLYLAPSANEHMFAGRTDVRTVGWIKAPDDLDAVPERWGRGLWLTMSVEMTLIKYGTTKTLGLMNDWLRDWLWIKFAPFPQFDEIEGILKDRGLNILDRNITPPVAARHFDFVVTNGESSVVRESALMGIPTFIVTDIGLFSDTSRKNLWQFADLHNVHVIPNLESIPDMVTKQNPVMQPFDMETAIDAIVAGTREKLTVV